MTEPAGRDRVWTIPNVLSVVRLVLVPVFLYLLLATTAYGWTDYTPDMPDDEILRRLLALNLARSSAQNP